MIQEFRDFVNKGNFVDLAVAFVMGVAFTTVVTAFIERVVMPMIALVVGQPNFDNVGVFTDDGTGSIGAFLTAFVNFLLIGFVMFLVVKAYNRFREPEEAGPPPDVELLTEIRDELRAQRGGGTASERTAGV